MPHNPEKRREAGAKPLVLFGEHGRVVEGYRPANEDLEQARHPEGRSTWVPVQGPHLRAVRTKDKRSKTGVVGISLSRRKATGRHYYVTNLGSTNRCFCIETLGRAEAWRRAVALRYEHERKIAQANTVILKARSRYGFIEEGAS
jgi:hypothetical protein